MSDETKDVPEGWAIEPGVLTYDHPGLSFASYVAGPVTLNLRDGTFLAALPVVMQGRIDAERKAAYDRGYYDGRCASIDAALNEEN